jgi:membrane protein YdbS with pleckstrin-like domain
MNNSQTSLQTVVILHATKWMLVAYMAVVMVVVMVLLLLIAITFSTIMLVNFQLSLAMMYVPLMVCFILIVTVSGVYLFLYWSRNIYIIGKDQVTHQRGVFWQKRVTVRFPSLDKITIRKGFMGKLLGFGSLIVTNSVTQQSMLLHYIPRPRYWAAYIEQHFPGPESM